MGAIRACAGLGLALVTLGASAPDPGILLEIDGERFELRAHDLREDATGPSLRVALGSPAHPTPRGAFPVRRVIGHPAWTPGPAARDAGAQPTPAGANGPLGVAKIPFAAGGAYALHGGAHPLILGKPVSLGCVRSVDADLEALLAWLEGRGALGRPTPSSRGEFERRFRRPVRLVVR